MCKDTYIELKLHNVQDNIDVTDMLFLSFHME